MKYEVPSFETANLMSVGLTIVIMIILAFGFYVEVYKKEKKEEVIK